MHVDHLSVASDWRVEDVCAWGIDLDETVNLTQNENFISVPDITDLLDDEIFALFSAHLDPLKESNIFGVDIYVEALTINRD